MYRQPRLIGIGRGFVIEVKEFRIPLAIYRAFDVAWKKALSFSLQ